MIAKASQVRIANDPPAQPSPAQPFFSYDSIHSYGLYGAGCGSVATAMDGLE